MTADTAHARARTHTRTHARTHAHARGGLHLLYRGSWFLFLASCGVLPGVVCLGAVWLCVVCFTASLASFCRLALAFATRWEELHTFSRALANGIPAFKMVRYLETEEERAACGPSSLW
jgi:hypothetical protein